MYRNLAPQGIRIPNGFAITAEDSWAFIRGARLDETISALLHDVDMHDILNLRQRGAQARQAILGATTQRRAVYRASPSRDGAIAETGRHAAAVSPATSWHGTGTRPQHWGKISHGPARVITDVSHLREFQTGDV
jgi:hypothetical protein